MGHGGTLDPLATGVLILGVGSGTKSLASFLECTKSYECVVLFGAATDTYDTEGKVVARKPYDHVTRANIEEALDKFRGKIMQKPPIFSALRIQGKRLYEYAREGKELPVEIKERPVEVEKLELVDFMEGGSHEWQWPDKEVEAEEKEVIDKVLHLDNEPAAPEIAPPAGVKRSREEDETTSLADETVNGNVVPGGAPSPKRSKTSPEPVASGALPDAEQAAEDVQPTTESAPTESTQPQNTRSPCPAPAARIRMTVTSGFYVRSLCHDLGTELGTLGIMTSLVRTRQGDFELGSNVLMYDELAQGEDVWAPKVRGYLEQWEEKEQQRVRDSRVQGGSRPPKEQNGSNGKTQGQRKPHEQSLQRRNSSSEED